MTFFKTPHNISYSSVTTYTISEVVSFGSGKSVDKGARSYDTLLISEGCLTKDIEERALRLPSAIHCRSPLRCFDVIETLGCSVTNVISRRG